MKKVLLGFIVFFTLFFISGCEDEEYTVSFIVDSNEVYSIEYNEDFKLPFDPSLDGSSFEGWYFDEGYTKEFNFDDVLDYLDDDTIKVYAKFSENLLDYKVSFYSEGRLYSTVGFKSDSTITMPNDPISSDLFKEFDGWYYDVEYIKEVTLNNIYSSLKDDPTLDLYAKFKDVNKSIEVKYYNGEELFNNIFINSNITLELLSGPETTEDLMFDGWYLEDGSIMDTSNLAQYCTNDLVINLYAKFASVDECTIKFNYDGVEDIKFFINSDVPTLPTITKKNHIFVGWSFNNDIVTSEDIKGILINNEIKLNPVFKEVNKYTIVFNNTLLDNVSFYEDEVFPTLEIPSLDNHTFDGWYLDEYFTNEFVVEEYVLDSLIITLYAKFEEHGFMTINFITDTLDYVEPIKYYKDTILELPTVDFRLFNFDGWLLDDVIVTEDDVYSLYESNSTISLKAKFTAISYTITFNNELCDTTYSIKWNAKKQLDAFTNEEYPLYQFDGWYLNGIKVTRTTLIGNLDKETNIILEAKYSPITYTITLDNNLLLWDVSQELVLPVLEKAHYDFNGWLFDDRLIDESIVKMLLFEGIDCILTSSFTEHVKYNIYFDTVYGDTIDMLSWYTYEAFPSLPKANKEGSVFFNWYYEGYLISDVNINELFKDGMTLKAIYLNEVADELYRYILEKSNEIVLNIASDKLSKIYNVVRLALGNSTKIESFIDDAILQFVITVNNKNAVDSYNTIYEYITTTTLEDLEDVYSEFLDKHVYIYTEEYLVELLVKFIDNKFNIITKDIIKDVLSCSTKIELTFNEIKEIYFALTERGFNFFNQEELLINQSIIESLVNELFISIKDNINYEALLKDGFNFFTKVITEMNPEVREYILSNTLEYIKNNFTIQEIVELSLEALQILDNYLSQEQKEVVINYVVELIIANINYDNLKDVLPLLVEFAYNNLSSEEFNELLMNVIKSIIANADSEIVIELSKYLIEFAFEHLEPEVAISILIYIFEYAVEVDESFITYILDFAYNNLDREQFLLIITVVKDYLEENYSGLNLGLKIMQYINKYL